MSGPFAQLALGEEVARETLSLTRDSLVRYAGASGDFNAIHYRDDVAQSVGLAGVLAHGMLTMGLAIQPLSTWVAGRGVISSYQVRFTKPVYVPPEGAIDITVSAVVSAVDSPKEGDLTLSLSVTIGEGVRVLGKALAVVSAS